MMTASRLLLLLSVIVLLPDTAFAAAYNVNSGGGIIGDTMCDVAFALKGELAAAVATVAICSLGVMACLGRLQWVQVLVVIIGIVLLFGAATLADSIGDILNPPSAPKVANNAWGGCE